MIGELYEKQRITITVIDAKRLYLEIFSLHKLSKYHKHLIYCFYSTTKHAILQISNHYLLCSLDPLNLGRLFKVIGPKLITILNIIYSHDIQLGFSHLNQLS